MKKQMLLAWGCFFVMFFAVLVMNVWNIPSQDELAYAFTGGMAKPLPEEIVRVESITAIIEQQVRDYVTAGGNGRVFLHGLVAFFSGFKFYLLFDFLNTLAWFFLVFLILKVGRVQISSSYILGCIGLWWGLWYAEPCSFNAAYSINYLWMACATILMMKLWESPFKLWHLPLFFLYGWSQEAFVLPFIVALLGGMLCRHIYKKQRFSFVITKAISASALCLGALFLCNSPSSANRASGLLDSSFLAFLMRVIKAQLDICFYPSIGIMLAGIVIYSWWRRREIATKFLTVPEWYLFTLSAYGLYSTCQIEGGVRLLFPTLLGCSILFIDVIKKIPRWIVIGTVIWMVLAAGVQWRIGSDVKQMLEVYKSDSQGITKRPSRNTFPFLLSVYITPNDRENLTRFMWEAEKDLPITVFSPRLYEHFYLNPKAFIDCAMPIPGTSFLYAKEISENVAIAQGDVSINNTITLSPSSFHDFLPGRFRNKLFPTKDCFISFPEQRLVITAKDGQPYTLYIYPPKK